MASAGRRISESFGIARLTSGKKNSKSKIEPVRPSGQQQVSIKDKIAALEKSHTIASGGANKWKNVTKNKIIPAQKIAVAVPPATTKAKINQKINHMVLNSKFVNNYQAQLAKRKLVKQKKLEESETHQEMVYLFNLRKPALSITEISSSDNTEDPTKSCFKDGVVHPNSNYLKAWYMLIGIIICYQGVYIPFVVSFNPNLEGTNWEKLDSLIDFIFYTDLILHFNIAYYRPIPDSVNDPDMSTQRYQDPKEREKLLVRSHFGIAKNYLSGWFWIDLLAVIPFDIILSNGDGTTGAGAVADLSRSLRLPRFFSLLRLVRALKIFRVKGSVLQWLQYSRASSVLRLLRLVLTIFVIVHLMGCTWYSIAGDVAHELDEDQDDLSAKYATAFYTSLLMVMGESIVTKTVGETYFVSVCIVFGAIIMAIIFGNVAMLVSNFYADSTAYRQKIEGLLGSMKHLGLPSELQGRIQLYYSYLWEQFHTLDGDTTKFVTELSSNLQLEVHLYLNAQMIRNVWILKESSPEIVQEMVLNLKKKIYMPNDNIINEGEIGLELFFIQRGDCEVFAASGEMGLQSRVVRNLESGTYFGEIALMLDCRRTMSVRAKTFCYLNSLHRQHIQEILKQYQGRRDKVDALIWSRYRRPKAIHRLSRLEIQNLSGLSPHASPARISSSGDGFSSGGIDTIQEEGVGSAPTQSPSPSPQPMQIPVPSNTGRVNAGLRTPRSFSRKSQTSQSRHTMTISEITAQIRKHRTNSLKVMDTATKQEQIKLIRQLTATNVSLDSTPVKRRSLVESKPSGIIDDDDNVEIPCKEHQIDSKETVELVNNAMEEMASAIDIPEKNPDAV